MKNTDQSQNNSFPRIGLLRRFVAMTYDLLLWFSILILAGWIAFPLTQGEVSVLYQLYLLVVSFLYFAWQWVTLGQTLGMKTWHIQIKTYEGQQITWQQAFIRFSVAILSWAVVGLGFFRALFYKEKWTWHDEASGTQLVFIKKE